MEHVDRYYIPTTDTNSKTELTPAATGEKRCSLYLNPPTIILNPGNKSISERSPPMKREMIMDR